MPRLNLMDITGPKEFTAQVVLLEVIQTGPNAGTKQRLGQLRMALNTEIDRNLIVFADQTFAEFSNPLQIRLIVADGDSNQELGETIIDVADANKPNELFIKFFVNGMVSGPYYELGYKVFP
jgi:hypothetical protein